MPKLVSLMFVVLMGFSCSASDDNTNTAATDDTAAAVATSTPAAAATPTVRIKLEPVFDVPSLFGKNIDEVRQILGTPTDVQREPPRNLPREFNEWENSFNKNGYDLLVTYNFKTRRVVDFFIQHPNGQTRDKELLMDLTNVSDTSSIYTLKFVPVLNNPNYYTGLIVTKR